MEKNDWMESIEQEFLSQTPEQIDKLLNQCYFYFGDNNMIINIIKNVRRKKSISFKQWKALKAHLSKHQNPTKTI